MGIAYALNIGIRRALSSGYKWIFTFDQDSIPIRNFYIIIMKFLEFYLKTWQLILV